MERRKKSSKRSTAPKLKDLDVQQRRLALIKQKQCDSVALHIVQHLINSPIEEDVFLKSLKYINQCHYQDIVEERAITKMCGYPICIKTIPDMPAKKYHISTKSNKVYDIKDRKNYCSNFCYKAGIYIKEQMMTSPLWFRDKEVIPEFRLLPKTQTGIPGIEVDQGLVKVDVNEDENFTSVSKFTEDMINDIPENMYNKLDIDCEKSKDTPNNSTTSDASNVQKEENIQTEIKKDEIKEIIVQKKDDDSDYYYSNLYTPSLADILKENAEYFDKKPKTENINKNVDKEPSELKSPEVLKKTTIETNKIQKCSTSENVRIGFDRTVINNKRKYDDLKIDERKLKGILSKKNKSSSKETEKRRVSFNSEENVREIEARNINLYLDNEDKLDKKQNNNETSKNRYKNTNLIGTVQEKANVCRYQVANSNNNIKDNLNNDEIANKIEINLTKIYEDQTKCYEIKSKFNDSEEVSTESKNVLLQSEIKISDDTNVENNLNNINITDFHKTDTNSKEKRMNRLKNSSAYKKANHISISKQVQIKNESDYDIKTRLQKCTEEWFTIETFIFLYGEEYVKNMISEKSFKQYLNKKKNIDLDDKKQKKYDDIVKRLNLMELADRKFDESVTGKKLRPLPRYEDLREQAETMDLRVQAFYSGCYEIDEDAESETESIKEEEEEAYGVKGTPAVLPLIDSKDFNATRKKIFLICLSRTISGICEILKQSPNCLLSDIIQLIDTFEFSAKNIVFKTKEWELVVFILIKIISIRDKELDKAFDSTDVTLYLKSIGNELNINDNSRDLLSNIINVENLLTSCIKKNITE